MSPEIKALVADLSQTELLKSAVKLERIAREIRVLARKPANLTAAEKRYCRMEAIPKADFLKRKLARDCNS